VALESAATADRGGGMSAHERREHRNVTFSSRQLCMRGQSRGFRCDGGARTDKRGNDLPMP
jgi:hypothetical protein